MILQKVIKQRLEKTEKSQRRETKEDSHAYKFINLYLGEMTQLP